MGDFFIPPITVTSCSFNNNAAIVQRRHLFISEKRHRFTIITSNENDWKHYVVSVNVPQTFSKWLKLNSVSMDTKSVLHIIGICIVMSNKKYCNYCNWKVLLLFLLFQLCCHMTQSDVKKQQSEYIARTYATNINYLIWLICSNEHQYPHWSFDCMKFR